MLLLASDSVSWLSVVIGGGAVLLGGIGAQGLSIWHDARDAKDEAKRRQEEISKALVAKFVAAVETYYSRLYDFNRDPQRHAEPDDTDVYLAFTEIRLWGPLELYQGALEWQRAVTDYAQAVGSGRKTEIEPAYAGYDLRKRQFIAAVRVAFGVAVGPEVTDEKAYSQDSADEHPDGSQKRNLS